MNLDDVIFEAPDSSSNIFDDLGGFNSSGDILTLLCSANIGGNSSLERHDGPPPVSAVGGGVQLFRIIFDLYVVGLICLIGFIGK